MQEQLPNLGKREATTARRFIAFVVERNGKFLVRQRLDGVVNAHLWEFPNIEVLGTPASLPASSKDRLSKTPAGMPALPGCGFTPSAAKPLCIIKHSITRYRITLEAWRAELGDTSTKTPGRWLTPKQLHELAFASAHKKILARIGAPISKSAR